MNSLWLLSIAGNLIYYVAPISLIIMGVLAEKNFVSRLAIFGNVIALNIFVYGLNNPSGLLTWYANIGIIFGIIALLSYASKTKMSGGFYLISWVYSSVAVGITILLSL